MLVPMLSASMCALILVLPAPAQNEPTTAEPPVRKVLVLGVDGMRGDALTRAETPHLDRLVAEGSFRTDATNAWTAENAWNGHSATNWGVLLTGVSPARTDLCANGDGEHGIRDDEEGPAAFPTLFGHVKRHDAELETAVFYTWAGIGIGDAAPLARSASVLDHDFCPESGPSSAERDVATIDAVVQCLAGRSPYAGADPDVVFVHLSQLDSAGHAHSYGSPEYGAAVGRVDALIGRLLAAIAARPRRDREAWLILLSADHGGPEDSKGHADNSLAAVHTVPFLLWADGLERVELERPSLYDITPTALAWLGIDPEPLELDGRSLLPR